MPTCQPGYTCLKDWYDTSRTTTADAMCGAYSGRRARARVAIIYKVAQACGINPQVLLVMLQKEQGLVTHTWPSDWRYTIAMGQGCPDTAACDTRYYGFFNQVYGAAWQLKRYANPPGTSQYFTWYAPGKTWNVRYHPNAACGIVAGLHPEPGDGEPLLLHAVPAERRGAARGLRRGRRVLGLRQPQLLQLLHRLVRLDGPRRQPVRHRRAR